MKTCAKCGEEKARDKFPAHKGAVCRACKARREQERRAGPEGDRMRALQRERNHQRNEQRKRKRRGQQQPPPHRWLPHRTAECELGVGYETVHRLVLAGRIRAHTYLRRVYLDPGDVEAVRQQREAA